MRTYYTYLWLRESGTPYYVGKGTGRRAFTSDGHSVKRPKISNRILVQEFPDEQTAFEAEIFLIGYYGRLDTGTGCLRNRTDGGDAPPNTKGRKASIETRRKMSLSRQGKKRSMETCKKMSASTKGRKLSPEWVDRLRKSREGKSHTAETRSKMVISQRARRTRELLLAC